MVKIDKYFENFSFITLQELHDGKRDGNMMENFSYSTLKVGFLTFL